ncbi:MAG: MFS transporter, partial [Candidatus Dormibacterales bacterium]
MRSDELEDPAAPARTGWREVLRGPQSGLTLGLTLLTLSVATESLVITAIMPAIVRDIGGLSLYGFAFSAFFLAGLVSIPIAGWGVDRFGPAVPFGVTMSIFLIGTLIAALSPNMPVLVLARGAQGLGAAAQFTISQSTIARAYPLSARVRVLSLMSATWILPSLLGPSLGAAITSLLGWRWAFGIILLPALLATVFTFPLLRQVRPAGTASARPTVRRPLQVALGTGLLVTGLTYFSWWGAIVTVAGLAVAVDALRHTLPAGSLSARRGLPAIVAASFFLNLGFYAAASFVPLVLVGVRGTSVFAAGLGIMASTVAWTVGVWLNTQLVDRYPRGLLVAGFAMLLAASSVGFATAIYGAPLLFAYLTLPFAGLSMGICFNTLTLNAMAAASRGAEGFALAGRNLTANLGTAVGTGVGGAALAASQAAALGL